VLRRWCCSFSCVYVCGPRRRRSCSWCRGQIAPLGNDTARRGAGRSLFFVSGDSVDHLSLEGDLVRVGIHCEGSFRKEKRSGEERRRGKLLLLSSPPSSRYLYPSSSIHLPISRKTKRKHRQIISSTYSMHAPNENNSQLTIKMMRKRSLSGSYPEGVVSDRVPSSSVPVFTVFPFGNGRELLIWVRRSCGWPVSDPFGCLSLDLFVYCH